MPRLAGSTSWRLAFGTLAILTPLVLVVCELLSQFGRFDGYPTLPRADEPNWLACAALGVVALVLLLPHSCHAFDPWWWSGVSDRLRFHAFQGWGALSFGAALASIATGLFYLFPVKNEHFERFTGIIGIYGAVVAR